MSDDLMMFQEEDSSALAHEHEKWKLLIVDDEEEIHQVTKMVLRDYSLEGRGLEFLHAKSAKQAKEVLAQHSNIALILLDVVMEEEHAGLDLVPYIRKTLGNSLVRIILRTGQPGMAPERKVILDYDINDYKEKSELTSQKLFTAVTASLRGYNHLAAIEKSRVGLNQIIRSSSHFFGSQSLKQFAHGVLTQLLALLQLDDNSIYIKAEGFSAAKAKDDLTLLAATGKFEKLLGSPSHSELPANVQRALQGHFSDGVSQFDDNEYLGVFNVSNKLHYILYFCCERPLGALERDLVNVFAFNVGLAFENMQLQQEIVETQAELIETLGELIETRSEETAHHVKRVSSSAHLLAQLAGLNEAEANLVRLSSPMHDVGKIGIAEAIINKPGRLSEDEYKTIQTHPQIGHTLLKSSDRSLMKAASVIALEHHEKWDGSGYPLGKKGEEIHQHARIVGLVDVWDAITHDRCYKTAWPIEEAVDFLKKESGKHFDPKLVELFLKHLDEFLEIRDRYSNEK